MRAPPPPPLAADSPPGATHTIDAADCPPQSMLNPSHDIPQPISARRASVRTETLQAPRRSVRLEGRRPFVARAVQERGGGGRYGEGHYGGEDSKRDAEAECERVQVWVGRWARGVQRGCTMEAGSNGKTRPRARLSPIVCSASFSTNPNCAPERALQRKPLGAPIACLSRRLPPNMAIPILHGGAVRGKRADLVDTQWPFSQNSEAEKRAQQKTTRTVLWPLLR